MSYIVASCNYELCVFMPATILWAGGSHRIVDKAVTVMIRTNLVCTEFDAYGERIRLCLGTSRVACTSMLDDPVSFEQVQIFIQGPRCQS